jgi:hypothetical protein
MEQVKIGGKNYECEKFGVVELADVLDWMQERYESGIIRRAKLVYEGDFPDKVFDLLQKKVSIDEISSDLMAMVYLIWLSVRKHSPSVTFDTIKSSIGNVASTTKIFELLSPDETEPEKKEPASQ